MWVVTFGYLLWTLCCICRYTMSILEYVVLRYLGLWTHYSLYREKRKCLRAKPGLKMKVSSFLQTLTRPKEMLVIAIFGNMQGCQTCGLGTTIDQAKTRAVLQKKSNILDCSLYFHKFCNFSYCREIYHREFLFVFTIAYYYAQRLVFTDVFCLLH